MPFSLQGPRILFRRLLRTPLFTGIAVLTLALGIGANSAIFSVVNGVLLSPLPFADSEGLLSIGHTTRNGPEDLFPHSNVTYLLYREHGESFEDVAIYQATQANLTGGDRPERLPALVMTEGLLPLLRVEPVAGRRLTAADVEPGAAPVVLLSRRSWERLLGGDPSAVGRTIRVNGVSREVVGVLPDGIRLTGNGGQEPELFLPLEVDRGNLQHGSFSWFGLTRLRPGVTVEAARADMSRLVPRMMELYPGPVPQRIFDEIGMVPRLQPLKDDIVGDVGRVLWVLLGTVGIVLLIACANVANLFLVRAEGRSREVALRRALGAGPRALAAGFLAESLALAMAGGVLGLGLADAGLRLLRARGPTTLPRLSEVELDATVILFTMAVSLLAGLLFGLFPILRNRSPDTASSLKEGGRGSSGGPMGNRVRNALVVSQVALALVLLVGSGLMLRSFQAMRSVDSGIRDPEGILTLQVAMPTAEVPDPVEASLLWTRILDRIGSLPTVEGVGAVTGLPMTGQQNQSGTWFEDFPIDEGTLPEIITTRFASHGFFETLGIPILAGRTVERRDVEERERRAWVNEAFARQYFGGAAEAVGRRVRQGPDSQDVWLEITGVVGNVRENGVDEAVPPILYPLVAGFAGQGAPIVSRNLDLAVRTGGDPAALAAAVRDAVWAENANLPVANVRTQAAIIAESMSRTSFAAVLLVIAAAVALLLGSVGIYGVIAYVVSQRTREIGVRVALGARREQVRGMVMGQALRLAILGILAGAVVSVGASRLMAALLFEVSPVDPATYGAVVGVLVASAAAAAWIPARRAASVEPLEALRAE